MNNLKNTLRNLPLPEVENQAFKIELARRLSLAEQQRQGNGFWRLGFAAASLAVVLLSAVLVWFVMVPGVPRALNAQLGGVQEISFGRS